MNAVLTHSQSTGLGRTILLLLAHKADVEKRCDLSNAEIAKAVKRTERHVARTLAALCRESEIRVHSKRPRVLLIDPQPTGAQLELTPAARVTSADDVMTSPHIRHDILGQCHDTHAGAGRSVKSLTSLTSYPQTPNGAEDGETPSGAIDGPTPRRPLRERIGRRRGRRPAGTEVPPARPCPLDGMTRDQITDLRSEWERLAVPLRGLLGDSQFDVWLDSAHLHAAGERVEIGCAASTATRAQGRYAEPIKRSLGVRVVFVPCAGQPQAEVVVNGAMKGGGLNG